ncbi:MAG: DUF2461 domain-containing protein [Gemmobacter sp.]
MSDGFDAMIAAARRFLGELEGNNTRDWFEAHKPRFKAEIEGPAKLLVTLLAEDLSRLTGIGHIGKLGRIYRDVRFSRDKSPYNTYIHAYWEQGAGAGPGWLLRVAPEGATFLTGLHALDADGLARYRAAVDRDGDGLRAAIDAGAAQGAALHDFDTPPLVRVPRPYAADHPHGDLLRRKQIALGLTLDEAAMGAGLIPALHGAASVLMPFWRWCDRAAR